MNENINKKQNRKMTVFALILSAISIGLLAFGFFLVSSDKVVMLQSISNLTGKLNNVLEDNELLNKIASNNNVGIRSNTDFSSDILGINGKVSLDYLENQTDKNSNLTFKLSVGEDKLVDLNMALSNDNLYFFVDDLTPKYYSVAFEYVNIFSKLNGNDYDKVISLLKDAITNSIDNKDIKKEKVTISYNGKDKKVNQLTYEITKDTVYDIMNKLISSIKKDKTLLSHIASLTNITTDELITAFDTGLEQVKNSDVNDSLYYRVYYYGFNKIVQYELTDKDENAMIQYKIDGKEIINLYVNKEIMASISITKAKEKYEFNGFVFIQSNKINISGTVNDNHLVLIIKVEGNDIKIDIETSKENKDNVYNMKDNITISLVNDTEEQTLAKLSIESEYYFGDKVKVNLKDSTNINDITEEDMTTIMENIENYPIYQVVQEILANFQFSL